MTNHLSLSFLLPPFLPLSPPPRISFSFTPPSNPRRAMERWHLFIRIGEIETGFSFLCERSDTPCVHSHRKTISPTSPPLFVRKAIIGGLKVGYMGWREGGKKSEKEIVSSPPSNFHAPVASSSSSSSKFPLSPSTHSPARLPAHGRGEIFFVEVVHPFAPLWRRKK